MEDACRSWEGTTSGSRSDLEEPERHRVEQQGRAPGAGPSTEQGTCREGMGAQGRGSEAQGFVFLRIPLMMRQRKLPPEREILNIIYLFFSFRPPFARVVVSSTSPSLTYGPGGLP